MKKKRKPQPTILTRGPRQVAANGPDRYAYSLQTPFCTVAAGTGPANIDPRKTAQAALRGVRDVGQPGSGLEELTPIMPDDEVVLVRRQLADVFGVLLAEAEGRKSVPSVVEEVARFRVRELTRWFNGRT